MHWWLPREGYLRSVRAMDWLCQRLAKLFKSVLNRRLNDAAFKENKKATRQLEAFIAGVAPIRWRSIWEEVGRRSYLHYATTYLHFARNYLWIPKLLTGGAGFDSLFFELIVLWRDLFLRLDWLLRLKFYRMAIVWLASYAVSCAIGYNTRIYFCFGVQWEHLKWELLSNLSTSVFNNSWHNNTFFL